MTLALQQQLTLRVVLDQADAAESWPAQDTFAVTAALLDRGYAVTLSGRQQAATAARSAASSSLVLRRGQGQALGESARPILPSSAPTRDITGLDAGQVTAVVDQAREEMSAVQPGAWKPWFPVIDYERCTNCMQCLSFCLFGVYGVDEQQRITVQTSDNCKTNCPACSRVCPEAAILFPKYKSGPINGDVVSDADLQREKMKIDISALLGGDVYSLLRERSERAKSRFSKERDSNKALEERKKCLIKLAQAADIPPEVLMSLPSPEEIARRAEEARAQAQAALQRPAASAE